MVPIELHHLLYISRSNVSGDAMQVALQLQKLLQSSQQRNRALNVTGALLFSKHYFVQVIEGSKDTLAELFERIERDSRHHAVYVVAFEPIKERQFSGWSMAGAFMQPDELLGFEEIQVSSTSAVAVEEGALTVRLMEYLIGAKERAHETQQSLEDILNRPEFLGDHFV